MCVIAAKYFPDYGWVAVKNRDRNYTPEISFKRYRSEDGIERLMFEDDITHYCEGINSDGVGILGASLMVDDDEKEIQQRLKIKNPVGVKIKKSLKQMTALDAVKFAVKNELVDNTIFVDDEDCFILEACRRDGDYKYKVKQVPKDSTVSRTNHGVLIPWSGYQRGEDKNQTLSRISSEARLLQAEYAVESANDPQELIDNLCKIYIDHPQLNVMRTDTERKKMRTTAQLMLIPRERTLFCRPVSSSMTFDFWKLNRPGARTWVEILSNRPLYQEEDDSAFDSVHATHSTE